MNDLYKLVESKLIPCEFTAKIGTDIKGNIYINVDWWNTLKDWQKIKFIDHELYHINNRRYYNE